MNGGRTLADALRAFHQGETEALGEVHEHLLGIARGLARRYGLGIEDAQDAAGQVLVTLLQRRASLHVASYVVTRIRGELLDVLGRLKGVRQPPAEDWEPERSRHLPVPAERPEPDAPATPDLETVIEDLRGLARDEALHMRKNDASQFVATLDGLIEVRIRGTLNQDQLAASLRLEINALQARESRARRRLLERCATEMARSPESAERMGRVARLVRALAGHQ